MKALFDQVTRTVAVAGGKSDARRRKMQAVRAAIRRHGIDEDDRRALQLQVTGTASMADMTPGQLEELLDHLNRDYKGPNGHRAHIGKVRALWWSLYWLGAVDQPNDRAIGAFVERQTGVSALAFLDHRQAFSVIEALKSWVAREGVEWPVPPEPVADRQAVAAAIWRKLVACAAIGNIGMHAYVRGSLNLPDRSVTEWSLRAWDDAIRLLGKRLRQEKGRK